MKYSLPKTFKCCLTCTYWCGPRTLVNQENHSQTDSVYTKGMCANRDGFYHIQMNAQGSCFKHKPWDALR